MTARSTGTAESDQRVLVTGGAGFIGANLVRLILAERPWRVITLDKLTYAGNLESLPDFVTRGPEDQATDSADSLTARHIFVHGDICDRQLVEALLQRYQPTYLLHLAAESHVDRSIRDPMAFVETNVMGTGVLLDAARRYWETLNNKLAEHFRFVLVSTDEVYGSLGLEGYFSEDSAYDPSSPYAASKASADHLAQAYHRTYGLPLMITHCSNNYGPYHFPEKLIPLTITRALSGASLPIYGRGNNIRDWLYVEDHCRALLAVAQRGQPGRTYNIGGNEERQNIEVVRQICNILESLVPRVAGPAYETQIEFVEDRQGHDFRYAIDARRICEELAWSPRETFQTGLERTIRWYLDHQPWTERVMSGAYRNWIKENYGP